MKEMPSLASSVQKPLKVPSLVRSMPKCLKLPSRARSVLKPLKVPSLARSVQKPLKVPSLARSVPPSLVWDKPEGSRPVTNHRCRPPTSWSLAARYEYRLLKVNRRPRGTRYDSPKLIVDSEVRVSTPLKLIVGSECGTTPPS